jgi:hypothetical protein
MLSVGVSNPLSNHRGSLKPMRTAFSLVLAAAVALAAPALAQDPLRATAEALRDKALNDPVAYDTLAELTTDIGPRQVGTPQQKRAMEWGLAKLKALGFQNVHAEPFTADAWLRGPESAEITAPFPQKLAILGLGRSISTPPQGIEAEVVAFSAYQDLLNAPPGSLAGKIAFVDQPMVRAQDGSGYGALVKARTGGASEAAKRGAVAYIVRSIATSSSRLPHAGAMRYADGVPQIPAAALSTADADLLARMAAQGPVRLHLKMDDQNVPNVPAWNVVGEVTGSSEPDQVIVIGGHMDSRDPGTGAIDDGAGMMITTGAAKLINDLPRHPKRTIRVVLFGAEEMDYAGAAYAAAHKDETQKMVLAAESDEGSDAVWTMSLPPGAGDQPGLKDLAAVLAPLKVEIASEPAKFSGTDTAELVLAGVPPVAFRNDASRYFDWHHSADDTFDKVDKAQLNQNIAAWAAFLYLAADGDVDFRAGAGK